MAMIAIELAKLMQMRTLTFDHLSVTLKVALDMSPALVDLVE